MTNLPRQTPGWRGELAYIDAAHRVHARVEDAIRSGKDCGIGKFPSQSLAMNKAWLAAALTAATLLPWLRLLAVDDSLARAEPKTLRILHAAARLARGAASDSSKSRPPGPGQPTSPTPDQRRACPIPTTTPPGARGTPGHPARQPGRHHSRKPETRSISRPQARPTLRSAQRESSRPGGATERTGAYDFGLRTLAEARQAILQRRLTGMTWTFSAIERYEGVTHSISKIIATDAFWSRKIR